MSVLPRAVVALIAGATMTFAFAPFGYFVLAPVALAVLFALWCGSSPGAAFLYGLAFGFAGFLGGTYWTFIGLHEFGGVTPAVSLAATLGLALLLSLFVAVVGWLAARWLLRTRGVGAWLCALPAAWVLAEWCRGFMFSGFGWLSVGYSQTDSWLMSYAPVLGLHGVSLATALSAGALLGLIGGPRRQRRHALVALTLIWGCGWGLGGWRWTEPRGTLVTVALVQGAVAQDLKWEPAQLERSQSVYRELTDTALGQAIVVWPEVAIPSPYARVVGYLDVVAANAAARGSTVVLGILRQDPSVAAPLNAVVALTEPRQFYLKRHLVPFGEYVPGPAFMHGPLNFLDLPRTDLTAGASSQPLLDVAGERLAVTICYEDAFGAEQLDRLPSASLLVNVSNDAWFGTSIAADQHLQIARMRAAEVGRYMLRATNTGISAIIDPQGRVARSAPVGEAAVIRESIQGFRGSTPYVVWRNYAILTILVLLLGSQLPITKFTIRSGT